LTVMGELLAPVPIPRSEFAITMFGLTMNTALAFSAMAASPAIPQGLFPAVRPVPSKVKVCTPSELIVHALSARRTPIVTFVSKVVVAVVPVIARSPTAFGIPFVQFAAVLQFHAPVVFDVWEVLADWADWPKSKETIATAKVIPAFWNFRGLRPDESGEGDVGFMFVGVCCNDQASLLGKISSIGEMLFLRDQVRQLHI